MALQVWLPLTKDLRNQGVSDLNFSLISTNTATDTSGKLGSCYTNNTLSGGGLLSDKIINLGLKQSMFCWFKFVDLTSSSSLGGGLVSQHRYPANQGMGITIKYVSSTTGYLSVNTGTGSSRTYNTYCGTTLLQANTWYHGGYTYDNGILKIYVNGNCEYIGSIGTMSVPADYITAFCWSMGSSTGNSVYGSYKLHGSLNDIRIYDHCLSPMEVKELAKGLVLHYPLNRQGWGQENLITQAMISADPWKSAISGTYTIDGKTGWILANNILYSKSGSGANNIFSGLTYETNTQYTISFKWRDDYRTDGKSSSLYIRFKYSDGTYSQVISSKDYNYWKEEIMTSTVGKTVSAITTTYGNGGNLLFTDLKLEKGAIKTPTSPIVNSDLYNSMGLNSTTEYDCSGFCNNGNKMTDTITYTSDTPKYAVSTHFNGTYDGILIENLQLSNITNTAVTYAFWIKPESESSGRSIYFGSYSSTSWSIEKTAGGQLRLYWNGSPDETCSGVNITDGVWQHICITKNGTNDVKVYFNGVQKWTSTTTHSNLAFPTTYRIGRDIRSNDGTPYRGLMSDFRIYATALSASDVQSLYQNCATIDPDGTIRGQIRS